MQRRFSQIAIAGMLLVLFSLSGCEYFVAADPSSPSSPSSPLAGNPLAGKTFTKVSAEPTAAGEIWLDTVNRKIVIYMASVNGRYNITFSEYALLNVLLPLLEDTDTVTFNSKGLISAIKKVNSGASLDLSPIPGGAFALGLALTGPSTLTSINVGEVHGATITATGPTGVDISGFYRFDTVSLTASGGAVTFTLTLGTPTGTWAPTTAPGETGIADNATPGTTVYSVAGPSAANGAISGGTTTGINVTVASGETWTVTVK